MDRLFPLITHSLRFYKNKQASFCFLNPRRGLKCEVRGFFRNNKRFMIDIHNVALKPYKKKRRDGLLGSMLEDDLR